MDPRPVLAAYTSAWAGRGEEEIRHALARCWTADSTYISPLTDLVRGVDALINLILDLPVMFPGATVTTTAPPDIHHDAARVAWRLRSTAPIRTLGHDFGPTLDGVDFAEFDDTGRIERVTAFFGTPAGIPVRTAVRPYRPDLARPPRILHLDDRDDADRRTWVVAGGAGSGRPQ